MTPRISIKKWVHINELGGDPWIRPIWHSVHIAVSAKRVPKLTNRLRELGVHISARLNFLPRIIDRINEETRELNLLVRNRPVGHESSAGHQGYALPVNDELKYRLLIDIDALLFELNALYEHWLELFKRLHVHAGASMPQPKADESIRYILTSSGGSVKWLEALDKHRNYFMHHGAPYVAVDVSKSKYDLLVLKGNVIDLSVSNQYIRLSEVNTVVQGFLEAKPLIRDYLMGLYT